VASQRLGTIVPSSDGERVGSRATVAAVDVASLLVRLGANAAASGRGSEAPEQRSAALDAKLGSVTAELAARAREVERPVSQRGDVVAHHLAAGLRVRFSQAGMLQKLSAGSPDRTADPADLEGLRDAWLGLATNEYVAVAADPNWRVRHGLEI
jgi:hypothetical protein